MDKIQRHKEFLDTEKVWKCMCSYQIRSDSTLQMTKLRAISLILLELPALYTATYILTQMTDYARRLPAPNRIPKNANS